MYRRADNSQQTEADSAGCDPIPIARIPTSLPIWAVIDENVMSNLKKESASGFVRLFDAAGLSMALKIVGRSDLQ